MGQPVKVSDRLLLDARMAAEAMNRSITGQLEHWARLGRAIETVLRGTEVLKLAMNGGALPLSELLSSVDTPEGRKRVAGHLQDLPYPHYETAETPGLLVRIESDGTRTVGRFVNRQFQTIQKKKRKR